MSLFLKKIMNFRKRAFATISQREPKLLPEGRDRTDIFQNYGMNVFNEKVMSERLPKDIFKRIQKTMKNGEKLDPTLADIIAAAIRDWAVSMGATHYTHWFQSMTGMTAEKHDAFTSLTSSGQVISEFSGKMLIRGESDASSFPSGGIRSTFEARGYTAWDPTSPVFINETLNAKVLCIPTVFLSYTGEALDRKVPLLRSLEVISTQALRILKLFGSNATKVINTVGAEQEYFLIDKEFYMLRPDLISTGRTLYGAKPPKGQELEDHYYGNIPSRVLAFMVDAEDRLIKLGIPVKTRHNEVAPAQYEVACIYEAANIASDHNIMVMNVLRETAKEHDFVCLLHEKPFASVNGSGKHNNWSLADNLGNNLLEPGDTPELNAQFLIFLASIVRATHLYSTAFRLGTICPGNDHRLGANEAPPAIISVFLGTQLNEVVHNIINDKTDHKNYANSLDLGVLSLPHLPKDATDRNRTSPMAFTGNKFEFRAQGSSQPVAQATFVMNAAISVAIDDIATDLEKIVASGKSIQHAAKEVLKKYFTMHEAVIYNGDNYSDKWVKEAMKRGLPNLSNVVDAINAFTNENNIEMFSRFGILKTNEIPARQEILFENYIKTISIEANSTTHIGRNMILPVAIEYSTAVAANILSIQQVNSQIKCTAQMKILESLNLNINALSDALDKLDECLATISKKRSHSYDTAVIYRDKVMPLMSECRKYGDALELLVDDDRWVLPRYQEIFWIN